MAHLEQAEDELVEDVVAGVRIDRRQRILKPARRQISRLACRRAHGDVSPN